MDYDSISFHWQLGDRSGSSLASLRIKCSFQATDKMTCYFREESVRRWWHTLLKNKLMHVPGKREGWGGRLCGGTRAESQDRLWAFGNKNKYVGESNRECAKQYLKKDCLLIKTAVWNTRIQMCNQKPATNKTYKHNTLKQLSSCLNRTPACGRLSWGRKQIFPFCVQLLFPGKVNDALPIAG